MTVQARRISDAAPIQCAETIQDMIRRVAEQRGHRHLALQSGAGHDTIHVVQLCPVGMIFVPSHTGWSHVSAALSNALPVDQALRDVELRLKEITGQI